jgi:hypothetical protein
MKKVFITTKEFFIDINNFLNQPSLKRNCRNKSFYYVAMINKYYNLNNVEREFINDALTKEKEEDNTYFINRDFVDKLKPGDLLEIKINDRDSNRYSYVSLTYWVVNAKNDDGIEIIIENTAFRAYNHKLTFS